jgi:predicted transcriptional regulator YdeE
MEPEIIDKKKIKLVGIDYYGDPFRGGEGWSMQNVVGRLWQRFEDAYRKREASLKHRVNDAGYELWIDFEGEETGENKYIFVGMEVAEFEDVPLEFVTRELPETRYAVYTLRGEAIKTDWPQHVLDWISAAGLE